MPRIHRFSIEKNTLARLPKRDLAIFLGAGKILNELNIGTKYLLFCVNAVSADPQGPERTAAFTAVSFFLRVLAGHVCESYEYFRKAVRVDELRKSKSQLLNADFYSDVKTLQKYFGRANIVAQMRQKFAFHTDMQLMVRSFETIPDGFAYEVLLGQEQSGHNVFYGSEAVVIDGVQHLKQGIDWDEAITAIFRETTDIAHLTARIFQRVLGAIMDERLGLTMNDAETLMVAGGPPINNVVVPFFCNARAAH